MSPPVALALALAAALSLACPMNGSDREQTAEPASSTSQTQDSEFFERAVQVDSPSGFDTLCGDLLDLTAPFESDFFLDTFTLNDPEFYNIDFVPSIFQVLDPLPVEEATPLYTDPVEQFALETVQPDHARLNPNSDKTPKCDNAALLTAASPSQHITHPESVHDSFRDSGPSHPPSVLSGRKRKRPAPSTKTTRRRDCVTPSNVLSSDHHTEPAILHESEFDASASGSSPSRRRYTSCVRDDRLWILLPLLDKLENLDALQAEAEKHQVEADCSHRSGRVSRIPRLSESVQDRVDLFAAHYLRYFDPHNWMRRPHSEKKYRLSLECLLLCYYGHCGGDREIFHSRFPRWGQCKFNALCNGIHQCSYDTKSGGIRSSSNPDKAIESSPRKVFVRFRGRRAHVLKLISGIALSADDFKRAQKLEDPRSDGVCVVPRLYFTDSIPMTVVVAHYSRHFGPDRPQSGLKNQDITYRHALQCMIVCYYEHYGGVDAAFRARFGEFPCLRFNLFCSKKSSCNADGFHPEREPELRLADSPTAEQGAPRFETAINDDVDDPPADLLDTDLSMFEEFEAFWSITEPDCDPAANVESETGPGPSSNPDADDGCAPVAAPSDDQAALLNSNSRDVTASVEPVVNAAGRGKQCFPWPPDNRHRPWRTHLWSLLEKIPDLDQLKVEAKQHELQFNPAPDHPQRTRRVPLLSEVIQDRIELFAAHYLRYFGPGVIATLFIPDITYARSLESLLFCYYNHCDGDRDEFDRRHAAWAQCSFHMMHCNSFYACNYLKFNERRGSYFLKTAIKKKGRPAVKPSNRGNYFRVRDAHVYALVSNRVPSTTYFQEAQLREIRRPAKSAIPQMRWSVGDPIEILLAHYWRYFGPDASRRAPLLKCERQFRCSLECLIVCYYEHNGGNEAAFRRNCPPVTVKHFYNHCKGKSKCDLRSAPASEGKKKG